MFPTYFYFFLHWPFTVLCSFFQCMICRFDTYVVCRVCSKVPSYLNVVDIAGLVKGAHEGQGLGNAFLSHIRACDAVFHMMRELLVNFLLWK